MEFIMLLLVMAIAMMNTTMQTAIMMVVTVVQPQIYLQMAFAMMKLIMGPVHLILGTAAYQVVLIVDVQLLASSPHLDILETMPTIWMCHGTFKYPVDN